MSRNAELRRVKGWVLGVFAGRSREPDCTLPDSIVFALVSPGVGVELQLDTEAALICIPWSLCSNRELVEGAVAQGWNSVLNRLAEAA